MLRGGREVEEICERKFEGSRSREISRLAGKVQRISANESGGNQHSSSSKLVQGVGALEGRRARKSLRGPVAPGH